MALLSSAKWRPYKQQRHKVEAPALKNWLLDRGSLTERLIAASHGAFHVEVLHQSWGLPRLDEARLLGIKPRQAALIREVILYGNNKPWVYARSILPAKSLDRSLRYLKRLGARPLGEVLFNDPHMTRSEIEVARLPQKYLPHSLASSLSSTHCWGRRSVFYLHNQPLLVSEIFLPAFII